MRDTLFELHLRQLSCVWNLKLKAVWVGRDNQEIADSLPYLFFLLTWQVGCFEVDQTEVTIVKTKIYTPVFKNVVNLKIYIKYIFIHIYVYSFTFLMKKRRFLIRKKRFYFCTMYFQMAKVLNICIFWLEWMKSSFLLKLYLNLQVCTQEINQELPLLSINDGLKFPLHSIYTSCHITMTKNYLGLHSSSAQFSWRRSILIIK